MFAKPIKKKYLFMFHLYMHSQRCWPYISMLNKMNKNRE